MKKVAIALLGLSLLIALALVAYHFISPKVVIINDSSVAYDEFVVRLPSSGVSVGPINPGSKDTVYFSRQMLSGAVTYSLRLAEKELATGSMSYDANGQLFRVVSFIIHEDGTVSADIFH